MGWYASWAWQRRSGRRGWPESAAQRVAFCSAATPCLFPGPPFCFNAVRCSAARQGHACFPVRRSAACAPPRCAPFRGAQLAAASAGAGPLQGDAGLNKCCSVVSHCVVLQRLLHSVSCLKTVCVDAMKIQMFTHKHQMCLRCTNTCARNQPMYVREHVYQHVELHVLKNVSAMRQHMREQSTDVCA